MEEVLTTNTTNQFNFMAWDLYCRYVYCTLVIL